MKNKTTAFSRKMIFDAIISAFKKLHPKTQAKNPVIFTVALGSVLTTILLVKDTAQGHFSAFDFQITFWLWFTVLFANFAEALAEGRGKARADSLRKTGRETKVKMLEFFDPAKKIELEKIITAPADAKGLQQGDYILCAAGDIIPIDGEVVLGIASVDESAITGESAPVIREAGSDRSAVTGGTRVVSDRIVIKVTQQPGSSFLDKMIGLIEGAKRQKTPNEIALTILLSALTIIFVLSVATLPAFGSYSFTANSQTGSVFSLPVLIALLVCLIPTTIGGLLSAIGISGMDRLVQKNVIAMSGRAIEAAGDIDTLLLDKTGTITLGNRLAADFYPAIGVEMWKLAQAAQLASLSDETPEGRSIVVLAKDKFNIRGLESSSEEFKFIPFSASTRMSGVDIPGDIRLRKGAPDTIQKYVEDQGGVYPPDIKKVVEDIGRKGGTPLVVCENTKVLGAIYLKDTIKGGMKERFAELRAMGIKTVMITGDNQLTAAAIAAEAGVDDFIAQATPESKLKRIREEQAAGRLIAMIGDGTNDAPALAQADVGVAMNSGTQTAREAGNMIDLDSNPTKLIEIVETGKQLLITRGALTTFSVANDVAKYFAILPALFISIYAYQGANGPLAILNVMHLATPQSAILSAIIFNALIIIALIPLALKGVQYRPANANVILRKNLLVYGLGGLIIPFIGIKLIDMIITLVGFV